SSASPKFDDRGTFVGSSYVYATARDFARFGLLYLRGGMWNGKRILPEEFVKQAGTPLPAVVGLPEVDPKNYGNASDHYGLLWWNNADGTLKNVPRDTYWTWGLYDSLIVVIPSLDIVVARAGQSWPRKSAGHYDVLQPFLEPVVAAADKSQARSESATPPYPPSALISGIEWAPPNSIVRQAPGSDNWPMTWGDDDALYTAYGDGKGFEPLIDVKLSMGLAKVVGTADAFRGFNLRAPSIETKGDGASGKKASGMLMVDGTLYLLARNAGNSQLAWSTDHGATWSWSDWKFTTSFGCPTFLNFGRNYAGARDNFVYIYSQDQDSAYLPADRMVLARVAAERIKQQAAYEFFAGKNEHDQPLWTAEVEKLAAVFVHPGRCYRSGISYNEALKRYLWCQVIPGPDTRFEGGLGIYDAPQPWGPWTTVFFTEKWDVGPGETASIPTKWISGDGQTIHLAFSGDDHFSVRRAKLLVAQSEKIAKPDFRVHEIGRPTGNSFGQTSAVDVDNDGDLDFISGRQFGTVFWFEQQDADRWIQHLIGEDARTDVGGVAFDVDDDGWVDQVSGGTWYRNPGNPQQAERWTRYENGAIPTHDNLAADIDGDGKLDLVSNLDKAGVFWYDIADDPTELWIEHKVFGVTTPQCHGGIAVGDIDGDGDNDIARIDRWLENADGQGEIWIERKIFDFGKVGPWGIQTRSRLVDVDADGDLDLLQAEGDVLDGRVAWFENLQGNGKQWEWHLIKSPGHNQDFHSLCVADFDNDGDIDIFSGGGPLTVGEHQWFLWENSDGKGKNWVEHVIRRGLRTHESVCGDVDGDGDIDILTKPWRGARHLFVENLLVDPAKPTASKKD
ncbi:MAG: VCBS repeat-containing protein, partial [Planctomycetales bacterium]|nr:VCBS repeat-containing protein [Planctomycetales bacterium]